MKMLHWQGESKNFKEMKQELDLFLDFKEAFKRSSEYDTLFENFM